MKHGGPAMGRFQRVKGNPVDLILLDKRANRQISEWLSSDHSARKTFGESYVPPLRSEQTNDAEVRVAFLLTMSPVEKVGFFDVRVRSRQARFGFYLLPRWRRHETVSRATDLLAEALQPWDVEVLTAAVSPQDTTTVALCLAGGLRAVAVDDAGQLHLRRTLRAA